jgi:hypothetical protein
MAAYAEALWRPNPRMAASWNSTSCRIIMGFGTMLSTFPEAM